MKEEEGARGWCGGREVRNNNRKSIVNFDWPNPLDAPSLNVPSFFLLLFFFFESRRAHELYNYSILIVASIHLVATRFDSFLSRETDGRTKKRRRRVALAR